MKNTEKTIEVLNDLILINNDRIEGYEKAIKEIEEDDDNRDLLPVFLRCIDESRRFKMELGGEVEVLGKDIESGTSTGGKLHRAWIDIKEAFTGHDRYSLLEECELGEDAIKKSYRNAIEDQDLPLYIHEMLVDQQEILMDAHDEIKDLRDSVH
jgi:uncharacterized protein (TIGR02284 family)